MRLFDLQSSCVDLFAQRNWSIARRVVKKLFTHHDVTVLHFGLGVSLLELLYSASLSQ